MNLAEKFIFFFVVFFGLFGLFTGFVREFFSLAGLGTAFFLAPKISKIIGIFAPISPTSQTEGFLTAVCGTVLYFVISHFGRKIYEEHVKKTFVRKALDRLLGTALGCAKGALVAIIISRFLGT